MNQKEEEEEEEEEEERERERKKEEEERSVLIEGTLTSTSTFKYSSSIPHFSPPPPPPSLTSPITFPSYPPSSHPSPVLSCSQKDPIASYLPPGTHTGHLSPPKLHIYCILFLLKVFRPYILRGNYGRSSHTIASKFRIIIIGNSWVMSGLYISHVL